MDYAGKDLYAIDSKGKLRVWRADIGSGGRFRTTDGLVGGSLKTSEWTQCKAKNVGRANATTPEQQAVAEVNALYVKKLKTNYYLDKADAPKGNRFFAPMLAKDYSGYPLWKKLYAQPKLDGLRAIARKEGFFSREGEKFASTAHLEAILKPLFDKHPTLILDGELYNHDLKDDFNEMSSLVRKQTIPADRLKDIETMVQYHVYDMFSGLPLPFGSRSMGVADLLNPYEGDSIVVVQTLAIPADPKEGKQFLDELFVTWLELGYEGQMVRTDEPYEPDTRSYTLLKRKEFKDGEFKVKRLEEGKGNWAGCAKRVIIELENGEECEAGLRGSKKFTKELLEGPLPKLATIRYLNRTPGGKLRCGVATAFFDEDKRKY